MSNLTVLFNEAASFILHHAVFLSANDSVIEKNQGGFSAPDFNGFNDCFLLDLSGDGSLLGMILENIRCI